MINHNMKSNFLFFFLLLFSSCTSWRTTHKSLMRSDSLRQVSHLTLRTTAIPESRTFLQVRLPIYANFRLPPFIPPKADKRQQPSVSSEIHCMLRLLATVCSSWSMNISSKSRKYLFPDKTAGRNPKRRLFFFSSYKELY